MANFDTTQTINSLINSLVDLDATHTTELTTATTVKIFQNVYQINWNRESFIRITLTTKSATPSGVRLKPALAGPGPSPPVVSSISPTTCVHGAVTFTLTINGFGHVPGTVVFFGAANLGAITYVNDTQGTVSVPAANVVSAGTVVVSTRGPGSQALSNLAQFVIT